MALMDMQTTRAPRILITRPLGQHTDFARQCADLGFQVQLMPCMQIVPRNPDSGYLRSLLAEYSNVLFTSTNAVNSIDPYEPFPWQRINVYAIGEATARALDAYGQGIALTPASPFNSEAYLAQMSHREPDNLLIIKGAGGRNLIQTHLNKLGWRTATLDVYERTLPTVEPEVLDDIFNHSIPDIVSVTSNEILQNLWILCASHHDTLKTRQLVCNSKRCADVAGQLGFSVGPLIAVPAGDKGQLACLRDWKRSCYAQ